MTTSTTGPTLTPPPVLRHPPSDIIDGRAIHLVSDGDTTIESRDPANPTRSVWRGTPRPEAVDEAVTAAREALGYWSRRPIDERIEFLRRWQVVVRDNVERIASIITDEMGKTLAESRFEAKAMAEKVDITLDRISLSRVSDYELDASATRLARCVFRPHGVMAVIGPFNFPAHLPNGHFVPALLLGNTVILKPSERTPGTGQLLGELALEAGFPRGILNVVQGTGADAARLVAHDGIDGVLFTGSWSVGRRIVEANLDRPGRIVALEMGGNNPAVVMPSADLRQAAIECVRSAFATTGQRCTCTRRIVVHESIADRFLPLMAKVASTLIVDEGRSSAPAFMGPIVTGAAAEATIAEQARYAQAGGRVLLESTRPERRGHFVTPGIVQVDRFTLDDDEELFGPLVRVSVTDALDDAIQQASATRFGLAAAYFGNDDREWEEFLHRVRAGCVNRNTGTAGASGRLPFGGFGLSGNHRPAGAFSVDYCAAPIASMVERSDAAALPTGMHFDDRWLD